jgi:hypothetical protein
MLARSPSRIHWNDAGAPRVPNYLRLREDNRHG